MRRPTRMVNLDHVLTQELVEVPNFELGPIRIARLPMLLHDLAYLRETGPGVDGVIGLDVLRLRSFSIEMGRRRITFGSSRTLRSSARMKLDDAYLAVEVQMLNRPVRLLLDTGVRTILLYRDRLGNRLPELRVEQQIRGASLGGAASLEVVTLPRVQLNGTNLERRAVLLQNSPAGFLPRVDGYLSLTSLPVADFPGSSALQFRLRKEHLQLGVSRGGWQRFLHSILSEVTFCLSDTFGSFPSLLGCWLLAKHRHSTAAADKAVNLVGCKSPHHQLPGQVVSISDACGGNEACSART